LPATPSGLIVIVIVMFIVSEADAIEPRRR
jgi:hypothetical protein